MVAIIPPKRWSQFNRLHSVLTLRSEIWQQHVRESCDLSN